MIASLWRKKEKLKITSKNPSCTHYDKKSDFARGPKKFFARKLSLSALLLRRIRASMTVEAAVALPICLLFLMNLAYAVEIIRLHNNLAFGLWDVGSRIAMYACEQGESSIPDLLTDFYIGNSLRSRLGEAYLDSSPLTRGSRGLHLWESRRSGEELNITLTYQVSPLSSLAGFRSFRMVNRCCVRLWTGYDVAAASEAQTYVYVAKSGSVFHKDRNCSHLQLSVRSIASGEVKGLRNQWGQKYSACEKCGRGPMPAALYVTEEGHSYHYREDCPGIKRIVTSMTLEEAAGYPACSRCGGG